MDAPPPSQRPPGWPERIGPYEIRGVLGRGGMGVVFDAVGLDGTPAALKIVQPAADARPGTTHARFQREARILKQLNHPSVVRCLDSGEADGVIYLAMEKIEGVSLLAMRRAGPLELEPLVELGVHLADALAHIHGMGVIHRDIKPANVLVRADGRPVLTDFGISGMVSATRITAALDLLGSPGFMAPEIVEGTHPSAASDQFALGRLLFELGARGPAPKLARKLPLVEMLRRALEVEWTRLPTDPGWPELARVLGRMLENDPDDRFASANEVREAFREIVRDSLDSETLSAHVERLDLQPSWALEIREEDGLLADLDRPAGEHAEDLTRKQPEAPAEDPTREIPPVLPEAFLTPAEDPQPTVAAARAPAPEPPRRRLKMPSIGRGGSATRAEPRAPPLEPPPPAPTELDTAETDLPPAPSPPTPAVGGINLHEALEERRARVATLEQRLSEAQRALRQRDRPQDQRANWSGVAAAAALALALGIGLGWWAHPAGPPPPVALTLVAPLSDLPEAPDAAPTPAPADLEYARSLYATAREQLSRRELESADATLRQCIEVARLPLCLRLRASLLALLDDPGALEALRAYLRAAPPGPERERLEAALNDSR